MKLQSAKLTVLFLTIAGWLFIGVIALFLTLPTLREIRGLSDEIYKAHSELEAQYANRRHLLSNSVKVQEGRATMRELSAQFVPKGQELSFITAVEAIAERYGVTERIQLVQDLPAPGGVEELKTGFEVTITGPYRAALQTLVEIERLPALIAVDTVSVRPGGSPSSGAVPVFISIRGAIAIPPKGL